MEATHSSEAAMDSVGKVVARAAQEANTRYDTIFYTKVKYDVNGRWHEIETTPKEFAQIMQSGEVDGRNIVAMELFKIPVDSANEDEREDKVRMIYNFVERHTNGNPWQMI